MINLTIIGGVKMIDAIEDSRIEFKVKLVDDLEETVIAFLNKDGGSIYIGVDSFFSNRKKIASKNGISNYSGSASQNLKLLNLLKQGKLKK